jgi:hypothetical protein
VPKKLDYKAELKTLKELPDNARQPVTARVSVACLRKLYRLCDRDALDLSTLVRQILEEQADTYLGPGRGAAGASEDGDGLALQLSAEVTDLAGKVCAGLGLDLPTLLRLVVTDALPGWVLRAGKARQQRQQALERLQNRLTAEMATWDAYARAAPERFAEAFRRGRQLIEEGTVRLDLEPDGTLYLVAEPADAPGATRGSTAENALQELMTAEMLVRDLPADSSGTRWRFVPQKLLNPAVSRSPTTATRRTQIPG